jgi:hypothetical protein
MKRLMLTIWLVLVLLIIVAPEVRGITVDISYVAGYYQGSGGEFLLVPSTDWNSILSSYNGLAEYTNNSGDLGFASFSTKVNPGINIPGAYTAEIGSNSVSIGTAWLYQQFSLGQLAGYDYTPPGRDLSAQALQKTIWWLEGNPSVFPPGASNPFIIAVLQKFGVDANGKPKAMADSNGEYNVKILHLTASDGSTQDMLVDPPPVPEPFTLIFLGVCLVSAAIASKKFEI